jgi:hypothetical protein
MFSLKAAAFWPWLRVSAFSFGLITLALAAETPVVEVKEVAETPKEIEEDEGDDVTKMAAFGVKAERLEVFGFRVRGKLNSPFSSALPTVRSVTPNTAAAKAGLRPGDRILTTDGASAAVTLFSLSKWQKLFARKAAEVASGKKSVAWVLEVESPDGKEKRTVRMSIPTPPPHWGATKWQPPEGRAPAKVEAGPLAELARQVLENGIWTNGFFVRELEFGATESNALLGYEWTLAPGNRERRTIFVTQQRGRTEIVLGYGWQNGSFSFLTSPAGAMEKAVGFARPEGTNRRPARVESIESEREAFEQTLKFWTHEVGRVSGRWPFEIIKTSNIVANADGTMVAPAAKAAGAVPMGQRAASFLKLTPATDEQKKLFADALGKLGADEGQWAYTETAKGLEDKRVTVVRVDPSKSDAERCLLLKIDGKPPTADEVKQWRFEGRDVSPALGDLPPIRNVVDTDDVRVASDDVTAIVFELPLRGGNAQFPAEKFQALFRVNKTSRGFEDFRVKLRESFRVAGVVSISEAGIEARFQTFDPAYPPQPVYLKAGGAVRVLLVKFARSFESTRTDFRRVVPFGTDGETK